MKEKVKKRVVKREKSDLKSVLYKRATGYDTTEIVEEYVGDSEGEIRLTKKKVTTKNVPPDMSALKMLLETQNKNLEEMTDEELEKEKIRLLDLLAQSEKEKGDKN